MLYTTRYKIRPDYASVFNYHVTWILESAGTYTQSRLTNEWLARSHYITLASTWDVASLWSKLDLQKETNTVWLIFSQVLITTLPSDCKDIERHKMDNDPDQKSTVVSEADQSNWRERLKDKLGCKIQWLCTKMMSWILIKLVYHNYCESLSSIIYKRDTY